MRRLCAVFLLIVAACGGGDASTSTDAITLSSAPAATSTTTTSLPATTVPASTTSTTTTTSVAATSTSLAPTTSLPPTTVVAAPPIVLKGDGLGVTDFGVPTEEALAALEAVLGPPSREDRRDTEPAWWAYWGDLGLGAGFDPWAIEIDGEEVFAAWSYEGGGPVTFSTDHGVTVGDTLADLRAAYGEGVGEVIEEPEGMWYVMVDVVGWKHPVMFAMLDGPDETSVIVRLQGGATTAI